MNNPPEMMAAYFAGTLSAEQVVELEAWLREDRTRTRTLLHEAMLDCHLGELLHEKNVHDFTSDLSDDSQFGVVLQALAAPEGEILPVDITAAIAERERERQEAIEREKELQEAINREAQAAKGPHVIIIPRPVAWLGLAAAIALVALIGLKFFPPDATPTAQPIAGNVDIMPGLLHVGHVSASYNAAWVGAAPDTGQLIADQRFEFSDGMVELTFNDGGVVLVQGPAVFQATGPNAMRLLSGRLTADIPKQAHGFTVDTPHLKVVDLGTEFGVEVDPLLASRTDVFTGKVVASGLAEQDNREPVELTAGLAASADVQGGLSEVQPARTEKYFRSLSSYVGAPAISGAGVYLSSPPKDLTLNAVQSYDDIFIFMERSGLVLPDPLQPAERVGIGPAVGQGVDVFLVHFDPEPAKPGEKLTPTRRVVLTFDRPILGVITDGSRLNQTDASLGSPQTRYRDPTKPSHNTDSRGTDLDDGRNSDTYAISDDGRAITITMNARDLSDQMRIITQAVHQ